MDLTVSQFVGLNLTGIAAGCLPFLTLGKCANPLLQQTQTCCDMFFPLLFTKLPTLLILIV